MIRDATLDDAQAICDLYNFYITDTVVSFEETPLSVAQMAGRIENVINQLPWLVWQQDDRITGYAYARPFHERAAYRHTVELGIYLDPTSTGHGVGTALYTELLQRLRSMPIHTALGGIALPNPGSVALHEKFGFEKVAHYKSVGRKKGEWIDVGFWQLMLK